MKVTLRRFLEITGEDLIETILASLYVDEWNEEIQEWIPKQTIQRIMNLRELDPYMDYEIISFRQAIWYELESQEIRVRKIEN